MAPDDPIGTVRAGHGTLAVRTYTAQPDADGELAWFIINIGGDQDLSDIGLEEIEDLIATWPIVYQP